MSRVYFLSDGESRFKIGVSTNPASRAAALQTGNGSTLTLLGDIAGDALVERVLHLRFKRWHVQGEWFEASLPALEEVGRVLSDPPSPLSVPRYKRRVRGGEKIELSERITEYLRGLYPVKTAYFVAVDIGTNAPTVQKWMEGGSLPNAEFALRLIAAYGPTFLAATIIPTPQWILDAVEHERLERLEAKVAALRSQLASLETAR